jgi:hypothetical protein
MGGNNMDREIILAIALIICAPVSFLIGYYYRFADRCKRLDQIRREMRESRYAYLARLEAHRLAWKQWTDEAMRESANNNKGEN